ncbi:hypothetical protein VTJ49DRAFT_2824 [Mycothermus thermophilus]|uniref:Uncharacterized protein n=1 Tax=Humicola insolens TaxID=85995 RepID=A0ABR3V8Y3_HUMIN
MAKLLEEITVGVAAGFIALGIFIGTEKRQQHGKSIASRSLLSSYWPTWLRSDPSYGSGVRSAVYWISNTFPVISFLVVVAGIVTPLGLYDAIEPRDTFTTPAFAYAPDPSAFGLATGPRLNHTFSRRCGIIRQRPCPGNTDYGIYIWRGGGADDSASYPDGLSTSVPDDVVEIFSSGTKGAHTTISNVFDIEWRQLTWAKLGEHKNGTPDYQSVGQFGHVDSSILDDAFRVVEGLVVDGRRGGVGFRNHTLPIGLARGGKWKEDILFIEPETQCVPKNLSIEYTVVPHMGFKVHEPGHAIGVEDLALVDHGGFANMARMYPPPHDRAAFQKDAQLYNRAYAGAWLSNFYTALIFNVTNNVHYKRAEHISESNTS